MGFSPDAVDDERIAEAETELGVLEYCDDEKEWTRTRIQNPAVDNRIRRVGSNLERGCDTPRGIATIFWSFPLLLCLSC